jgi:hypothetical protein
MRLFCETLTLETILGGDSDYLHVVLHPANHSPNPVCENNELIPPRGHLRSKLLPTEGVYFPFRQMPPGKTQVSSEMPAICGCIPFDEVI